MNDKNNLLRQKRNSKFKINVGVAFAGKLISTLVSLVRVPILVNYLSPEGYGLFITITSVANWIQLGQLGMGSGLVNALIECDSKDDKINAQKYVNSLWIGLALTLLILSLILFTSFYIVPWNRLFPSDNYQLAKEVPRTVAFTLITILLGILMTPLGSIYTAYQEQYKLNIWGNIQGVITLIAILISVQLKLSMATIALNIGLATLLINGINYFWLTLWDKPFLKFSLNALSVKSFRSVWTSSISFFLIEISALLVFQIDRFLILQFSNSIEVTRYTLVSTLYLTLHGIYFLVIKPLWPAFGEAIHRGDLDWTRRVFNRISVVSTTAMGLLIVVVSLIGQHVIQIWTGRSDVEPDKLLIVILGFYYLIRVWTDTHSIIMFSLNRQKDMLWPSIVHGLLNLILGVILGRIHGVYGIAVSSLISFSVSSGWWIPYKARKYLKELDN